MMSESNCMEIVPPLGEVDGASDEEPGPSPAGVVVQHDAWRNLDGAVGIVHEAVNAAIALVPELARSEIAVALSSDDAVRLLNAQFRGQVERRLRGDGRHIAPLLIEPLRVPLLRDAVAHEGQARRAERDQLVRIESPDGRWRDAVVRRWPRVELPLLVGPALDDQRG